MKQSFYRRYGLHILIAVVFLFPVVVLGAIRALESNKNDVREWLPSTFQETADYEEFRRQFENETFVLVSWDGCTLSDQRLKLFAAKIDPATNPVFASDGRQLFRKVVTGPSALDELTVGENEKTGERMLSLPYDEALRRLTGALIGPDRRQRNPDGALVDPKEPDVRTTCAVVTVTEAGKDIPRDAVNAVYDVAAQCNITREMLHLGGPPVDNVALDTEGERMIVRLAILCALVGIGLAYYFLRSARLTAIVVMGAIYCAGISLALVYFGGEAMDSIVLTMPAVVYTTFLSGGIQLTNYYRFAVRDGGLEGAPGRAIAAGWIPCALSAGTTAVGLLSLIASPLIPIYKFGLFAGLGVMATLVLLYTYLPAALTFWPPRRYERGAHVPTAREIRTARQLGAVGEFIFGRRRWIAAAFMLVMVVSGAGLYYMKTSVNLMKLFAADARIRQDYQWLEHEIGPLVPMEVVIRLDKQECNLNILDRMELVAHLQRSIEELPDVGASHTLSTVTFGPPLEVAKTGRGIGALGKAFGLNDRMKREAYARQVEKHRGTFLAGDYLAENGNEELWRINVRVAALKDIDYGEFDAQIRDKVEPILEDVRERGGAGIIGATYTGLTPLVYKAQRSLLNSLIDSFGWAFISIAAVMAIVFRSVIAGFLTMVPNVWPVFLVFGIMGWLGIAVDIGSMMTASVAVGVCVDDLVHYANWYRRGIRMGMDRRQTVIFAFENCAIPMFQSSAIIAFGLLTFALSNFIPTVRFGILMFLLLLFGVFADIVLTPAILASRLGYFFTPSKKDHAVIDDMPMEHEPFIDGPEQPETLRPQHTRHAPHQPQRSHSSRSAKP